MVFYLPAFLILIIALFLRFAKIPSQNGEDVVFSKKSLNKYDTVRLARFIGNYSIGLSLLFFILATILVLLPDQEFQLMIIGSIFILVYSYSGIFYLKTSKRLLNSRVRQVLKEEVKP